MLGILRNIFGRSKFHLKSEFLCGSFTSGSFSQKIISKNIVGKGVLNAAFVIKMSQFNIYFLLAPLQKYCGVLST
jgi:hypothetical protein